MVFRLYLTGLQLDAGLLWNTIVWPLAMGAIFGGLVAAGPRYMTLLSIAAAVMLLVIYVRLEGWPPFPPVAAKAKLAYLIALGAIVVLLARRAPAIVTTALTLLAAFVWLGWNKLSSGTFGFATAGALVPVVAAAIATPSVKARAGEAFLWPVALLCFAIGAAVLSGPGLGAFVGFTQVMGAFAAWNGGYLLIRYALMLLHGDAASIPFASTHIALIAFVMASLVVGLFAPGINLVAFAVLSLTLLVPIFAPRFARVPRALRPFATGLMTAVPAAAAILIAINAG